MKTTYYAQIDGYVFNKNGSLEDLQAWWDNLKKVTDLVGSGKELKIYKSLSNTGKASSYSFKNPSKVLIV